MPFAAAGIGEASWLPGGARQACVGRPQFTDWEALWVGVDAGGERSATAVVWANESLRVGAGTYHGMDGVLEGGRPRRALAAPYTIRELVDDPWRFNHAAAGLARERTNLRKGDG